MDLLIHATPERMNYVGEFLSPRLKAQGFSVHIYEDSEHKGNLAAYLESYKKLPENGDTWHLEDDVLPDSRFYSLVSGEWKRFPGIICGFGDKRKFTAEHFGSKNCIPGMFYSFPCIRIPNKTIKDFLVWLDDNQGDTVIANTIKSGKEIDYLFRIYLDSHKMNAYNFRPCLVEHIDEYLSGSIVHPNRQTLAKAVIFEDEKALDDLREWSNGKGIR